MSSGHRSESSSPGEAVRLAEALQRASAGEPFAVRMGLRCVAVGPGYSRVEMDVPADMVNLFGMTHGGAVFSLLDEAFQLACNSHGVTAYALNVSVTYVSGSVPGERLVAEAREVSLTRRTGAYEVRVTRADGGLVAVAQALAYRKGGRPPFLDAPEGQPAP